MNRSTSRLIGLSSLLVRNFSFADSRNCCGACPLQKNICARWMPQMLNKEHMILVVTHSQRRWDMGFTRQSLESHRCHSPSKTIQFKQTSTRKAIATGFFRDGTESERRPSGRIRAQRPNQRPYCATLKRTRHLRKCLTNSVKSETAVCPDVLINPVFASPQWRGTGGARIAPCRERLLSLVKEFDTIFSHLTRP
jgi:hypothetical protein